MSLHSLVLRGELDKINEFLASDACVDINAADNESMTALHWAAAYNEPKIVSTLLAHAEIDVNRGNKRQHTALHSAVMHNAIEALHALLADPRCEIDAVNEWAETALMLAAAAGHTECIDVLIAKNADQTLVNQWNDDFQQILKDHQGEPRLMMTAADNTAESTKAERFKTFSLVKLIEHPLSEERFDFLLRHPEIDVNGRDYYGMTAMHKLVAWNKPKLIAKLGAHRSFDVAALFAACKNQSPLHVAAEMNSDKSVVDAVLQTIPEQQRQEFIDLKNGSRKTARELGLSSLALNDL